MKKKHLKDLPVLTVALFLSLCMHGCSTEEIAQNEYLHVDIPENNAFSALQLETLSVAYQRLDEFVSIENGIFILNVSAKDVNISEELLRFIKAGIDARNNLIEIEKTLTRNGVELPIPVTPFGGPIDNPGTNPDNPDSGGGGRIEFYYGPGYYQTIAYLTHDQAIALFGFMQGTLNYTDWVAMISALVPPINYTTIVSHGRV